VRRFAPSLTVALVAALVPATALAQPGGPVPTPVPKLVVGQPSKKGVLIDEGQHGRLRLGGRWYFRQDDALRGEAARYFARRSLSGWTPIRVPHNWNAADRTLNRQSVGWYRKEFRLPARPGRRWKLRFESVNHKARIWLNGKEIGRGGTSFLPFEVELKPRKGRNRLVVRVNSRRGPYDLTHWRVFAHGGWWNFGGISREVYIRPLDTVDIEDLAVQPRLAKLGGPARVRVRLRLRNLTARKRRVQLALFVRGRGKRSRRIELSPRELAPHELRETSTAFTIDKPRLWQPGRPSLYRLTATAATGGERRSSFFRRFGVRRIFVTKQGRVLFNGRRLQLRGFSIHEDEPGTGNALTPDQRKALVRRLRQANATIARAHYPLHPALLEHFDRDGTLVWDQAPVYQLPNAFLDRASVRAAAIQVNRRMVIRDRSHPSVLTWSIGNELAFHLSEGGRIGPGFQRYVLDAARAVRKLDAGRLVALDRHSRLGQPISAPAFGTLDALGVNEYFGWYYSAAGGRPASKASDLGPYLDQLHAALPRQALFITEFGAEATGSGPVTEKGTYQFQEKHIRDHLKIQAAKPYVAGIVVWLFKDFRAAPQWTGGNTAKRAKPPFNNKGVIDESGAPKPAFWMLRDLFAGTRPLR
jgi:beta-glucuronidase